MRLLRILFCWCVAVGALSAQPRVVTTHTVLADLAHEVAGPSATVRCLVDTHVDPHSYDPKPADVQLLRKADLVITNGLGLEPWAPRLIESSGFSGPVLRLAEGLPDLLTTESEPAHHDHPAGGFDPHAWQDPRLAELYVQRIADALAKIVPEQASAIQTRTARYRGALQALHAYALEQFARIPAGQRRIVTSHDSLRYLGRAYGFTVIPVAGARPDEEPSARQLARLVTKLREENVQAVFFEANANPKLIQLIARETRIRVGGQLYADSLGPENSDAATYTSMFRHNVDTIVKALLP